MKPSGILLGLGVLALLALPLLEPWHACRRHAAWTTTSFTRGSCCSGERNAAASLKTVSVAQVDFRSNDRDGNKINDFWRGDIAGLYGICPPGTDEMVKLLEVSVAGADSHALDPGTTPPAPGRRAGQGYYATRAPKAGYWYRALRHADEKTPDPDRSAACAYPADYPRSGRWTYVVDEGNTIFKRDLGRPGGVEVFPTDEELKREWAKLD